MQECCSDWNSNPSDSEHQMLQSESSSLRKLLSSNFEIEGTIRQGRDFVFISLNLLKEIDKIIHHPWVNGVY